MSSQLLRDILLREYNTNNVDEASATVTYIGKETHDGRWLIQKIDTSSGTAISYATVVNNTSTGSYSTAWTGRAGLNYGNYSAAV